MTSNPNDLLELEEQLLEALHPVEAPPALLNAVMKGAKAQSKRSNILPFSGSKSWVGKIAATLLLGGFLVGGTEHHIRTEQRIQAERNFARSIEITNEAMRHTREQIQRAGVTLED